MGNKNTKNEDLEDLRVRLERIEREADLDGDGVVTKAELQKWSANELHAKDTEITFLRAELAEARQKNKRWEGLYKKLHERYEELQGTVAKGEVRPANESISTTAVEAFVDELLEDPNINIYMLPDSVERPIYVNTLKMVLSMLQKTLNKTNLDIIGHQFKVVMEPSEN